MSRFFLSMVCQSETHTSPRYDQDDLDLCADCKDAIIRDFRRIWPKLSLESKAVNAYRMRLDNYKE